MILKALKAIRHAPENALNSRIAAFCREEYDRQRFEKFNERPVEFAFVFRHLAELYPKSVLDVGTGKTSLPHLIRTCGNMVTATDNVKDYWPAGMVNRHYWVVDDDITDTKLPGQWDLVTCISVLEHVKAHDAAVRNLFKLVKTGGYVIITCPYNERTYHPNVYSLSDSAYGKDEPYETQSFSRIQLDRWCSESNAEIIEQEFWQFWTGELWTQGKQIIPPVKANASQPHQLTCLLLRRKA